MSKLRAILIDLILVSIIAIIVLLLIAGAPLALLSYRLNNFLDDEQLKDFRAAVVLNARASEQLMIGTRQTMDETKSIAKAAVALLTTLNTQAQANGSQLTATLKQTEKTLGHADDVMDHAEASIDQFTALTKALTVIASDPHLLTLIENLTNTSEKLAEIARHVDATTEEVEAAVKVLTAQLEIISRHAAGSSENIEATTLAVRQIAEALAKPESKKQKVVRYLFMAVIPSLIHR